MTVSCLRKSNFTANITLSISSKDKQISDNIYQYFIRYKLQQIIIDHKCQPQFDHILINDSFSDLIRNLQCLITSLKLTEISIVFYSFMPSKTSLRNRPCQKLALVELRNFYMNQQIKICLTRIRCSPSKTVAQIEKNSPCSCNMALLYHVRS